MAAATVASIVVAGSPSAATPSQSGASAAKRARTPAKAAAQEQQDAAARQQPQQRQAFVAALELLQWKTDVADAPALLAPLSGLLPALLAGANAAPAEGDGEDEEAGTRCCSTSSQHGSPSPMHHILLCLMQSQWMLPAFAVRFFACTGQGISQGTDQCSHKEAHESLHACRAGLRGRGTHCGWRSARCSGLWSAAAMPGQHVTWTWRRVLACAQQADSALVRSSASALLAQLASAMPEAQLQEVLQVGLAAAFWLSGRVANCILCGTV